MNHVQLVLVRGLPGSGKSTIAQMWARQPDWVHLEADQFFVNEDGTYKWQREFVWESHMWCQEQTEYCMENGRSVVVSNTFTQEWELEPYFLIARKFEITPTVIVCQNEWGNVHNCPGDTVEKMRGRFKYDLKKMFEEHEKNLF